ncbi:MAG: UDP-2,3-diacylglucosamine diphosphatase LpxI [Hyphomonadaceae bacterium]|nr:UDP-2,3-diacylglucosamine diphosphatase LpxI [Hyphomonadaceae bacterium]
MPGWRKLGVIAGGGALPLAIANHCAERGLAYFVARIAPFADAALDRHPGVTLALGEVGARIAALKGAGCDAITMIGVVTRPDLSNFAIDARGAEVLPILLSAAREGDDSLLRALVAVFEAEGFRVVGAEEALADLVAPAGALGDHAPCADHFADLAKAARVAAAIGALDIGQGAVVCDGLVLAVEAQEGTDAMLARVAGLPENIRGNANKRRGVLVKRPKPQQERRVDLPVIGLATVENVAAAGLAGVAVEAGGALVMDRAAMIARANALGLFVYGFTDRDLV